MSGTEVVNAIPWWLFWPWLVLVQVLAWWRLCDSIREIRSRRRSGG
jgi:ABC-type dipeptide/oligopeptide/nickel transport system permease subunit